MITSITLKPAAIEELRRQHWEEETKGIKGFEGYTLEADTDKGDFDSEKGAMTEYLLTLTAPDGKQFVGRGGYYTGVTGECYSYEVEFTPKKVKKKPTKADKEAAEYKLYLRLKKKYDSSK